MRRRSITKLSLLGLLAAAAVAATGGPSTQSVVAATDPCGRGAVGIVTSGGDVLTDAHDICDVTVGLTAGDGGQALEITIRSAGDAVTGSTWRALVAVGDCSLQVRHEADVATSPFIEYPTEALVDCGEPETVCTPVWSGPPPATVSVSTCREEHPISGVEVIDAPVIDGSTVTFTLALTGELEAVAAAMSPGAVVELGYALAAVDVPFFTDGQSLAVTACLDTGDCRDVVGDIVFGDTELVVGGR